MRARHLRDILQTKKFASIVTELLHIRFDSSAFWKKSKKLIEIGRKKPVVDLVNAPRP